MDSKDNLHNSNKIRTGFNSLDDMYEGFSAGDLIVIGGQSSIGKTSLLRNIAINIIQNHNSSVLFYTFESLDKFRKVLTSNFLDLEKSNINLKAEYDKSIEIQQLAGNSILDIEDKISNLPKSKRPRILIIDPVQALTKTKDPEDQYDNISTDRHLKRLAIELDLIIIVSSSITKETQNRMDRRPRLHDLKFHTSLTDFSDTVILLHRESHYDENTPNGNMSELILAKNRYGKKFTSRVEWIPEKQIFQNSAMEEF